MGSTLIFCTWPILFFILGSRSQPYLNQINNSLYPPDGEHCAIVLNEKNSHTLHLPSPCISVQFINEAFYEARHKFGLEKPFQSSNLEKHLNDIDRLGLVLTTTSQIIAQRYNLNHQQIFNLLPRLDVGQTNIPRFCPVPIQSPSSHQTCKLTKYRTLSGHCNNLYHPHWGAAFTPFQNFLPSHHSDGLTEPRSVSMVNKYHRQYQYESLALPSPRLVSQHVHQDSSISHDHSITTLLIAWGQIIDHDITLTGDTQDPLTFKEPECCSPFPNSHHHNCQPIQIPRTDPFYGHYGQTCMNFARSLAGLRPDCRLGTRKAFNRISSFLDGNFIYGSHRQLNSKLRTGKYGLLKSLPIFHEFGLQDLLPLKLHEPNDGCIRHFGASTEFCFLAGDIRVNEQLILTVLHTIFMREHNRIAKRLASINSHWNDERLFQETRRIVIGIIQHITFNEFLPMVLGKNTMQRYGLILETRGHFWDGYNPDVDSTASEEFVTSAFRFGHSLLPHKIERWSHGHRFIDSQHLHQLLRQPFDLYKPGFVDTFVLGLVNQLAQSMDEGVTNQVTTLLFKEPRKPYGMDLAAINIQRGREHGVPNYTSYRSFCNLSPISHNWNDLVGIMKNDTIYRYKDVYSSPHDIDLWSGGISELPLKDSLLGPTFSCLIAKQFHLLRTGDRFWYELPNLPSSFSREQLDEIRIVTLSRLLCDNTDDLKTVQLYSMVYPDLVTNPRVSCRGKVIPRMNLERWRESPPAKFHNPTHARIPVAHELDNHLLVLSPPSSPPTPHDERPSFDYNNPYNQHQQQYYDYNYHHYDHDVDDLKNPRDYQFEISSHPAISPGNFSTQHDERVWNYTKHVNNYRQQQQHHNGLDHGFYEHPPTNSVNIYEHGLIKPPPQSLLHHYSHYSPVATVLKPPLSAHESLHQASMQTTAKSEQDLNLHNKNQHIGQSYSSSLPDSVNFESHPYDISHGHNGAVDIDELAAKLYSPVIPASVVKDEPMPQKVVKIVEEHHHHHHPEPTRKRHHQRLMLKKLPQPFPDSPFPGWSGLFSPNPGYLVKQKFRVAG